MMETVGKAVTVKSSVEADLLKRPGVTGVDVGYKYVNGQRTDEIAIRVFVKAKRKNVSQAERVQETIEGVRTDVIQRTFELHQATNRKKVEEVAPMADTVTYDPVKGGISIGPCRSVGGYVYAGTLGVVVRDNATGNPMLLSNFHVMCIDNGWSVGDTMAQPSRIDTGTCPGSVVGTLQRAVLSAAVDGAISSLQGRGFVCEIADIGNVNGTVTATLGMAVRKRGRTTGLTYGTVDGISLSVNIDYGDGLGVHTLTNQIGIRSDTAHNPMFGDHGDSGSVVVDSNNNITGLYFAGSTDGYGIANQIASVLSELNISLCTSKNVKLEKFEIKDFKDHIKDFKERKNEKFEKREWKEIKVEKLEFDRIGSKQIQDGKGIRETPPPTTPPTQQTTGGMSAGLEARLAQLEAAVRELSLFITPEMRPDLGTGALTQEGDLSQTDLQALGMQLQKEAADALKTKTEFDTSYKLGG
jgi:hypothetical protein